MWRDSKMYHLNMPGNIVATGHIFIQIKQMT